MIRKSVIHELPEFSIQLQQSCINKVAAVKSERFFGEGLSLSGVISLSCDGKHAMPAKTIWIDPVDH